MHRIKARLHPVLQGGQDAKHFKHDHAANQIGGDHDKPARDAVGERAEERAEQLARSAFWLQREAEQPAYLLDIDATVRAKHGGTWTKEVFDAAIRSAVKSLGPAQAIKPWLPEPPRVETERLVLTWPRRDQLDTYYHAIIGTDIFDTLLWNGPSAASDMHDFWVSARQSYACGPEHTLSFAVIEKATDMMIGGCSLRPQQAGGRSHQVWDVGYAFGKPWHGKGYATEAVRALIDIAFRDRKAERVIANAFVGNTASRRVLEKLGFRLEGSTRSAVTKPSGRRDEWLLGVTH
jgi:RimJ/RimL family protein N-acetyltransferase